MTGTMEFYDLPYIGNFITPTDELIFFRGVCIPPTRMVWEYHGNLMAIFTIIPESEEYYPR
jgi:hypothetical protein